MAKRKLAPVFYKKHPSYPERDQEVFDLLHMCHNVSNAELFKRIPVGKMSRQTLYNLRGTDRKDPVTRFPRFHTMKLIAEAMGKRLVWTDADNVIRLPTTEVRTNRRGGRRRRVA